MSGLTSSLSDASHPGTLVSNLTYWPNGGLDTATLGNGVAETRSQDARGRVDSIADGSAYSVSIGHAPDGDVTSDTDSVNGAWAYGYDAQNRLASSSCTANCPDGAGAQAFSYTYDRYGNRWKQLVTAGSGPSPQFSFTANNNRMDGYSYDTAGDLLGDGAHAYAYDADHRLISVDNGSTASYSYNAAGQRATKTAGGVTHDYLYDLDGNMETEITNGGWSRGEVYAGGRRWASYANGTTYFEYSDWLDTARVNTQYGGGWTQTCQNDPFGDDLTCTGGTSPSPVHFTGKPRDGEDNLDYFGARYNASALGRFMTPDDPLLYLDREDPQSLNLYSYVQGNPATSLDPDGHLTIIVPGTDWSPNDWNMKMKLVQAARGLFHDDDVRILDWSGEMGGPAIEQGARQLAAIVNDHVFAPGEKLNVIGHSRGGDVALQSAWHLNHKIDYLVTLDAPVYDWGRGGDFPLNTAGIGSWMDVMVSPDLVAPGDSDWFAGRWPANVSVTIHCGSCNPINAHSAAWNNDAILSTWQWLWQEYMNQTPCEQGFDSNGAMQVCG